MVSHAQNLRLGVRLNASVCEGQMGGHWISIVRWRVNRICPIGLVRLEPFRRFTVKFHQVEFVVVAGRIKLLDDLVKLVWVKTKLLGKFRNRVSLFRLFVCRVVDPAGAEALHDGAVCDKICALIMVSPCLEGDHLESCKEVAFAFIIEALAIRIYDNT